MVTQGTPLVQSQQVTVLCEIAITLFFAAIKLVLWLILVMMIVWISVCVDSC